MVFNDRKTTTHFWLFNFLTLFFAVLFFWLFVFFDSLVFVFFLLFCFFGFLVFWLFCLKPKIKKVCFLALNKAYIRAYLIMSFGLSEHKCKGSCIRSQYHGQNQFLFWFF